MRKVAAFLVVVALLLGPVHTASAHENPCIEHNIMHVLLLPVEVAAFAVTLPLLLVGGKPYSHACPHADCVCHK